MFYFLFIIILFDSATSDSQLHLRHFLDLTSLAPNDALGIFRVAKVMKRTLTGKPGSELFKGRSMLLLFDKPSLRTRVSFETGFQELGGTVTYMHMNEVGMGGRESVKDVARIASQYCDVIVMRIQDHTQLVQFAHYATVPVINALTFSNHPVQILADAFTIAEHFNLPLRTTMFTKMRIAYFGDQFNNIARSWRHICEQFNCGQLSLIGSQDTHLTRPQLVRFPYEVTAEFRKEQEQCYAARKTNITIENPRILPSTRKFLTDRRNDIIYSLCDASVIYTDTWISMGNEWQNRTELLQKWSHLTVTSEIMALSNRNDTIFMHCLPAHRGEEVTDEVIDGPQSVVVKQAENRKYVQAALVYLLLQRRSATRGISAKVLSRKVFCNEENIIGVKAFEHDHNIALVEHNRDIPLVIELERVSKDKYSISTHDDREQAFITAAQTLNFNVSMIAVSRTTVHREISPYPLTSEEKSNLPHLANVLQSDDFYYAEHCEAHCALGFYDSPFETALCFCIHGTGSDGSLNVYFSNRKSGSNLLQRWWHQFSSVYNHVAVFYFPLEIIDVKAYERMKPIARLISWLAAPGKFMGYAGVGEVIEDCLRELVKKVEKAGLFWWDNVHNVLAELQSVPSCLIFRDDYNTSVVKQRNFARTFQVLVEYSVVKFMKQYERFFPEVDGLVLSGGFALNIKVNAKIHEEFNIPVWVPSAPGDNGLGLGAAWLVCPPSHRPPRSMVYSGLPLADMGRLEEFARQYSAQHFPSVVDWTLRLAQMLVDDGLVLGIVIGRQEFGPRALMHRSIIAYPSTLAVRDRVNALKYRQFYRPTAPVLPLDFVEKFYEPKYVNLRGGIRSPYMSFAYPVQQWVNESLPAVVHFDGSARAQTLTEEAEPRIYRLLQEVGKKGYPVLINTSLNIKGQPILNSIEDALELFCSRPQMDAIFIDEYLFFKKDACPRSSNAVEDEIEEKVKVHAMHISA